jgi:hypothetical protein
MNKQAELSNKKTFKGFVKANLGFIILGVLAIIATVGYYIMSGGDNAFFHFWRGFVGGSIAGGA